MKKRTNPLEGREQSGFPLSVGTGLALETLFDPINEVVDESRTVDKLPDLNRYDAYLINVETLVRNILSSVPTEIVMKLTPSELFETLVEEIGFLNWFFEESSLRLEFYYNTHQFYKRTYSDRIRVASTERQLHVERITEKCMSFVQKELEHIKIFSHLVKYNDMRKALMFTHFPADLLSHSKFSLLDLLESNTGRIKTKREFNTKYFPLPREDMSNLPFFEYLLVTFGDNVMFKPFPITKRREVFETLDKNPRVHPMMSEFSLGLMT